MPTFQFQANLVDIKLVNNKQRTILQINELRNKIFPISPINSCRAKHVSGTSYIIKNMATVHKSSALNQTNVRVNPTSRSTLLRVVYIFTKRQLKYYAALQTNDVTGNTFICLVLDISV